MSFLDDMKKVNSDIRRREEESEIRARQSELAKREFENSDIPSDVLQRIASFTADYLKEELKNKVTHRQFDTVKVMDRFIFHSTHYMYRAKIEFPARKSSGHGPLKPGKDTLPYFSLDNCYLEHWVVRDEYEGISYVSSETILYTSERHLNQFCNAVVDILKNDGCGAYFRHDYKKGDYTQEKLVIFAKINCDKNGNIVETD